MNRIAWTNLRSASGRLVAAGIAIAVSVAFIVAALLFSQAFGDTLKNQVQQEWSGADVAVQQTDSEPGGVEEPTQPLTPELRDTIADVDGVESANLVREGFLSAQRGQTSISAIATDFPSGYEEDVVSGTPPQSAGELVLREAEADSLGVTVGEEITLADAGSAGVAESSGGAEYVVSGLLSGSSSALTSLYMTEDGLEDAPAELIPTVIRITAQPDVTAPGLADRVNAAMEDAGVGGAAASTTDEVVDDQLETLSGSANMLSTVALAFGLLSAGVAALVISNTFQVLVASRARTLALYRAVGASRRQIRGATILEGLALGAIGSAAGVGLGLLIGWGLTTAARAYWMPEFAAISPTPAALLVGPVLGIVVTVLAGLVPAQRATRVSPIEALHPADVRPARSRFPWVRTVFGAILGVAGIAGCLAGAFMHSVGIGILGCFVLFIAVLITARAFVPALIGGLARLLAAVTGRSKTVLLAGRSARDAGGRTASTTAALLIGVTLVSAVVIGAASLQHTIEVGTSQDKPVDVIVDGSGAQVTAALDDSPVVEAREEVPAAPAEVAVDAGDGQDPEDPPSDFSGDIALASADDVTTIAGEPDSVLRSDGFEVESGTILLDPQKLGGEGGSGDYDGGKVVVSAAGQSRELTLKSSSDAPNGTALLSDEDARALGASAESGSDSGRPGTMQTWVRLSDDASLAQVQALTSQLEAQEVAVDSSPALSRAQYAQTFQIAIAVVLGLLAAAVVIAVIGVSNTLTLAVIDRRREGALLRALGFSRGALGRMITLESLLMTAVALVIGLVLGTFYGWVGTNALIDLDSTPELAVPSTQIALIAAAALVAAMLASAIPARSMSRIPPAEGMSRE